MLVLGAGFDTAAFQLQREGALAGSAYFELDFPDIVREKSRIVREQRLLCGSLCGPAAGGRRGESLRPSRDDGGRDHNDWRHRRAQI